MRLTELHPEWHEAGGSRPFIYFDCPHCRAPHAIQIAVRQGNPQSKHVWGWNGEKDFEKVTITPSIRFSHHWHGYVTNGDVSMLADEPGPAAPAPSPSPDPGQAPAAPAPAPAPEPLKASVITGTANVDEHGLPIIHDNIGHRDLIASLHALTERVRKLL